MKTATAKKRMANVKEYTVYLDKENTDSCGGALYYIIDNSTKKTVAEGLIFWTAFDWVMKNKGVTK